MASEVTKRLRDRRQSAWHELKELAETAASENRAFTPEEQSKWDVGNEELDTLDKRIKSALDAEKRAKDADDAFNEITKRPAERRGGDGASHAGSDGRDTDAELRAFLRGDRGAPKFIDVGHNPDLGPIN